MNVQWENIKTSGLKHSYRWGHSSTLIPGNFLVLYGGYADSKFLKDVWIFNSTKNIWFQVKFQPNSIQPKERSNCSFFYHQSSMSIIMFGGGSHHNNKLNDIWSLKIQHNQQNNSFQGKWQQFYPINNKIPWARTYHISQIFYDYLLIHGGQSYVGQVQDLWALRLKDLCWVQLKFIQKHQARKFHSSALIKQKLYIFGGIYGNYQTINKIQFVDLAVLKTQSIQNIQNHKFEWKQIQLNRFQSSLIGRWGHISKVYENNVYIFGGRTHIQQNDLIRFNPQNNEIQKITVQKAPQGRRRPCCWLIGSILIINSGYNGSYLLDQYSINLKYTNQQCLINNKLIQTIRTHKKQLCDIHINTTDNKYIDLNTKMIRNSFQRQDDMINMLEQLGQMKYEKAIKYVQILNSGVYRGKSEQFNKENQHNQSNKQQSQVDERLLKKYKITYSNNELLGNKKKILFNIIKQSTVMNLNPYKLIRVSQQQLNRIYNLIENDPCCDLQIILNIESNDRNIQNSQNNNKQIIKCSKYPLIYRSQYFKHCIQFIQMMQNMQSQSNQINKSNNNKLPKITQLQLNIQQNEIQLIKLIIIYCYYGHVVINRQFSLLQSIHLYQISQKYSLQSMINITYSQIKQIIHSQIFQSLINQKLQAHSSKMKTKIFTNKSNNQITNKQINTLFKQNIINNQINSINQKGFNPQHKNNQLCKNKQFIKYNSLDQQLIKTDQFQYIINFTLIQSSIFSNKTNKQFDKVNKWSQITQFILHKFSILYVKKYIRDTLIKKKKLLSTKNKHNNTLNSSNNHSNNKSHNISIKKSKKQIQLKQQDKQNKQNLQNKTNMTINSEINNSYLWKEKKQKYRQIQKNSEQKQKFTNQKLSYSNYLQLLISLVHLIIIQPLLQNKQIQNKQITNNKNKFISLSQTNLKQSPSQQIELYFRHILHKQVQNNLFKFNLLLSQIK